MQPSGVEEAERIEKLQAANKKLLTDMQKTKQALAVAENEKQDLQLGFSQQLKS